MSKKTWTLSLDEQTQMTRTPHLMLVENLATENSKNKTANLKLVKVPIYRSHFTAYYTFAVTPNWTDSNSYCLLCELQYLGNYLEKIARHRSASANAMGILQPHLLEKGFRYGKSRWYAACPRATEPLSRVRTLAMRRCAFVCRPAHLQFGVLRGELLQHGVIQRVECVHGHGQDDAQRAAQGEAQEIGVDDAGVLVRPIVQDLVDVFVFGLGRGLPFAQRFPHHGQAVFDQVHLLLGNVCARRAIAAEAVVAIAIKSAFSVGQVQEKNCRRCPNGRKSARTISARPIENSGHGSRQHQSHQPKEVALDRPKSWE